jgi:hypothetical protein
MKKKEIIKKTKPVKAARQTNAVKPLKVAKTTKAERPAEPVAVAKASEVTKSVEVSKVEPAPVKPAAKAASLRPVEIPLAIQKLLDTTNHIQARAAELENAIDAWHEHERSRAVKDLLTALRNSPDGDLLRFDPEAAESADAGPLRAVLTALTEAFSIEPVYEQGERIPVRQDEIPDSLELDRSIDQETGECIEVEVVSAGWKIKEQVLIKPVVRPLFRAGNKNCSRAA